MRGWTSLDRLDAGVTVLALVNPASGRPWLTDSLSQPDKTLAAAVGDDDVSTTKWRVAFDPKPGVSTVSFPSGAERAAADLARRVRAAPVGDGTVVTLGLTGDVSAKDRRAILDALTRYILTKKRQDITLDAVNRMDPIDRRITMLSTEFRERDRAFLELAEHTTATRETIASLYDSSREGEEIERVQLALAALRKERDTIDRESHSIFDDLFLIRYVQRTE